MYSSVKKIPVKFWLALLLGLPRYNIVNAITALVTEYYHAYAMLY